MRTLFVRPRNLVSPLFAARFSPTREFFGSRVRKNLSAVGGRPDCRPHRCPSSSSFDRLPRRLHCCSPREKKRTPSFSNFSLSLSLARARPLLSVPPPSLIYFFCLRFSAVLEWPIAENNGRMTAAKAPRKRGREIRSGPFGGCSADRPFLSVGDDADKERP